LSARAPVIACPPGYSVAPGSHFCVNITQSLSSVCSVTSGELDGNSNSLGELAEQSVLPRG
jgi:hypothetical protein